jgi:hypothetical protein
MKIDYDTFINFCKNLKGRKIDTIGGRSSFEVVSADQYRIRYRLSNGNIRSTERSIILKVLEKFEKTSSFTTTVYTDVTQAASYTLALLKLYQNRA